MIRATERTQYFDPELALKSVPSDGHSSSTVLQQHGQNSGLSEVCVAKLACNFPHLYLGQIYRPNIINIYIFLISISIFKYSSGVLLGSGQGKESKEGIILSQDAFSLLRVTSKSLFCAELQLGQSELEKNTCP